MKVPDDVERRELVEARSLAGRLLALGPCSEKVAVMFQCAVSFFARRGAFRDALWSGRCGLAVWRNRDRCEQATEAWTEGTREGYVSALSSLASVYRAQGPRWHRMIDCLDEAVEMLLARGHEEGAAWAFRELAALMSEAGRYGRAVYYAGRADQFYTRLELGPEVARCRAECWVLQARAYWAEGRDHQAARRLVAQAVQALDGAEDGADVEGRDLLAVMRVPGVGGLPEPGVLRVGEFGVALWDSAPPVVRHREPCGQGA
ncbi:tetratricopeptide repeat protein [Actinosynnema sp. CS-041913]|uniref:tetratricopeptide repeat protein n=1 Tax=Actinosynnema sp. CS-041913 TaxID=3239917 RepID=UPI003D92A49F